MLSTQIKPPNKYSMLYEISAALNDECPNNRRLEALIYLEAYLLTGKFWHEQKLYLAMNNEISHELYMYLTVLKEKLESAEI